MTDGAYQPTQDELERRMQLYRAQTGAADTPEDRQWYDYVNEVNTGLAHTLGLAVDVFAGPQATQRAMADLGMAHAPGEEGQDWTSRALQGVGETLPFSLSMLAGGQAVDLGIRTGQVADTIPSIIKTEAGDIAIPGIAPLSRAALSYSRAPASSAFRDLMAVGGAVTGGVLGEQATNEPWGRAIGEIVGGLSPSLAEQLLSLQSAARKKVFSLLPFKGHKRRAAERIAKVTGRDVSAIEAELDANILDQSPYVASGDPGLMAIQKSAMAEDAKLSQQMFVREANSYAKARELMLRGTDPAVVREYFTRLINTSALRVRRQLNRLAPRGEGDEANRVVREELDAAYTKARADEKKKWDRVADVPVEIDNVKDRFQWLLSDRTPESDPAQIPKYFYEFFGNYDADGLWQAGSLTARVQNVHNLRSRILDDIMKERAAPAPDRNKIRIMMQMQEALLDSLSNSRSARRYADALEFSSTLNNRFTKGFVGKLLGYERTGEASYLPEETVQRIMRLPAEQQAASLRQVLDASPSARRHVADVVRQAFFAQATEQAGDTGKYVLVRERAQRFLKRNEKVLNEFPDIRTGIEDSIHEQRIVDSMLGERGPVGISPIKKRVSAVSLYLDSNVGDELNRVMQSSKAPREAMRELVRIVKNDKDAAAGLRTATKAWVLQNSSSGQLDTAGELIPSGSKMLKMIDKHRGALNVVLSQQEIARMQRIGRELQKAELARQTGQSQEGVIRDAPNMLLGIAARVAGARAGAAAAKGSPGGSIQSAAIGSQTAKRFLESLTNDKAKQILLEAMDDESKFRTLLTDVSHSTYKEKKVVDTVMSWLAIPTVTLGGGRTQEEDELQRRMDRFREMYDEEGNPTSSGALTIPINP